MLEIFSKPDSHCKVSLAQDERGNSVDWDSMEACRFCLCGAFNRVLRELLVSEREPLENAMDSEASARGFDKSIRAASYIDFNEAAETTQADVVHFLQATRKRLECAA